jgi:hypothetical protein
VRKYFETLLDRKQGEYGPLWLFELNSGAWAIVWEECLDDEDTCQLILSEDPNWFNREWTKDGRRPNPTYGTPCQALEEIIGSLQTMKETFDDGDVKRNHYSAYVALAEYHLHTLVAGARSSQVNADELPIPGVATPAQALDASSAVEWTQPSAESETAPVAPAPQTADVRKPWEVCDTEPTASNFRPDLSLHAKMEWVCNNVPKMSRLRILREGAELLCKQLIEKHVK